MKFFGPVLISACAAVIGLAAAPSPAPAEAGGIKDTSMEKWITDLSDDRFQVREEATRHLWEAGDAALSPLKEAARADDPEQAHRARELLRKIELYITPDTDPAIIGLVESYGRAGKEEKEHLFNELKQKRAWRQMLKLFASEPNAMVRETLEPVIEGVANDAARERLVKGDAKGAREFLEMAPVDAASLISLAAFHRSQGTLAAELEKAVARQGLSPEAWELALHRVAGNVEAARDAAQAAGETRIAAAMATLAGDPLPWLRQNGAGNDESASPELYAELAIKRWQGKALRPADIDPLVRQMTGARQADERESAMGALFLLGEPSVAEATYAKSEPIPAFRHFESLERIPDALKILGIDPTEPDYTAWAAERLAKIGNDPNADVESGDDIQELIVMANFLERRGLAKELDAALQQPLEKLAKENENTFLRVVSLLFQGSDSIETGGIPEFGLRLGTAWAGDKAERWEEIFSAAFGGNDAVREWWNLLGEIKPAQSPGDRMMTLLALFHLHSDPKQIRRETLEDTWKIIERSPADKKQDLLQKMFVLATITKDAANALRAWNELPENERIERPIYHLMVAERWEEAAEIPIQQIARMPESQQTPGLHALAAACLRRAGKAEEAAAHDEWVEKLALGDPAVSLQIAHWYAFGLDFERASVWTARAVRESDPDSEEFEASLNAYATVQLENGDWKTAAATSEVVGQMIGSGSRSTSPLDLLHQRMQSDLARGLSRLGEDRDASIELLRKCHGYFPMDGLLADHFYPSLRKAGLVKEHDEWFARTWELIQGVIQRYPGSHNTRNTAGWLAARACRKLEEAEGHLKYALGLMPDQAAYLDTMGEIHFARGDRKGAVEWSRKAVNFGPPNDAVIREQLERFRNDPFPK